ncbi:hypothetical protein DFW101_0917 [Solidesulfovibrio carbinoliphilus subsp. oakridgensis]|uniref:Uncharacterized protein n=1 Tax=Solidesulfovibrio carbinoliphilus subsp. oakridgensis TaxID=694327 RepID=G7Q5Z5_9BACT|nr:hypothetical protein [Solidesulfovibrio carbinoliphilus]EHJ46932.1 hypothetical protein DFW101_0917 [Solidesulfovibrio carbinoliphilus subsp. oakridgensis]
MKAITKDTRGRFAKGNPGGPGRPARETELSYLRAIHAACPPDMWQEIVTKAVSDAREGDPRARAWLAGYLVGAPKAEVGLLSDEEEKERFNFF